jgi:hypothetical protein
MEDTVTPMADEHRTSEPGGQVRHQDSEAGDSELGHLRHLVAELLPFMLNDIEQGLSIGDPPDSHPQDQCPDCDWYDQSQRWHQRITAGEFDQWIS